MSIAAGKNDSVSSTPGNCIYPLNEFIDFKRISPSGSYLLLNTHFTGTGFIPFTFTLILLIGIHAFIEKIVYLINSWNLHKCPFGLDIDYLRVLCSNVLI